MATTSAFAFDDLGSFDDNLTAFSGQLSQLDSVLGPVLTGALSGLSDVQQDKGDLLSALLGALEQPVAQPVASSPQAAPAAVAATAAAQPPPPRWFLTQVEIEGFRGINNENTPLKLTFKSDAINSVSAPNGVGKSSIFDAISYAITGGIPKLDALLTSERGQEYYLNRFHPGTSGSVKITLTPDIGGTPVTIVVTRSASGTRTVSAPQGVDGDVLLKDLDREFVLLDAHTFQRFIDYKALDRGRSFSGLLGLSRYSSLRREIQALSNTRSFNSHFDTSAGAATKAAVDRTIAEISTAVATDYDALVKDALDPTSPSAEAKEKCLAALSSISVLAPHCVGQTFDGVDLDACLETVKSAEGGPKKARHSEVLREQDQWTKVAHTSPAEADITLLADYARARTEALEATAGSVLNELYRLSEAVISGEGWPTPTLCPTCDRDDGTSVLDNVRVKLGQYDAVELATTTAASEWTAKGWADLKDLEALTLQTGETPWLKDLTDRGAAGTLSSTEVEQLGVWIATMRARAKAHLEDLTQERLTLEKELPPSLVTVTTAVETARKLQTNWKKLESSEALSHAESQKALRIKRLKTFLDKATTAFARAESDMATERLTKVQPVCQDLFKAIMFSPVVPALSKPEGSEELAIRLAEFWGLTDVSAQALLSESYRNAFAVSVYLAAASLYGGAPRFIVLDDVTSSFDAGHQHHLIEVIRTKFARPLTTDGPQLIFLSHDTLLEKLFNKHSSTPEWSHQRLEGTARTAVLLQSGAVNKVRDATFDLLNAGRVDDAAPRIRQYLEYRLHEVIDKVRIPVPMDIAFGDDKRTPGEYLKAIKTAVDLQAKATPIILEAVQIQNLEIHSATIVGNFLSHWSSGQAQAFSAPALLGVMAAIDSFPECFRYTDNQGNRRYYRSLSQR